MKAIETINGVICPYCESPLYYNEKEYFCAECRKSFEVSFLEEKEE